MKSFKKKRFKANKIRLYYSIRSFSVIEVTANKKYTKLRFRPRRTYFDHILRPIEEIEDETIDKESRKDIQFDDFDEYVKFRGIKLDGK